VLKDLFIFTVNECCLHLLFVLFILMLQAIKQMYVLVFGLDVLGNPFGILRGLATGIEDLFYEPYQGAIQGPEEFAEGLALGVRSLLGHAVGKSSLIKVEIICTVFMLLMMCTTTHCGTKYIF